MTEQEQLIEDDVCSTCGSNDLQVVDPDVCVQVFCKSCGEEQDELSKMLKNG